MAFPVLAAISWGKLLKKAAPYLIIILLLFGIYLYGSSNGANKVQTKWDAEKAQDAERIANLKEQIFKMSFAHAQETRRITNALANAEKEYAVSINSIRSSSAEQLRKSSERAGIYQYHAQAGADQQRSLASHAAELDRTLTEGRSLVEEFAVTLRQRDTQLIGLGQQILNDRKLIEEAGNNNNGTVN